MSRTLGRGFQTNCERLSLKFRKDTGLNLFEPLPARFLAEKLGVEVVTPAKIQGLSDEDKQILSGRGSREWSAVTIDLAGAQMIIHNDEHTAERQESNIMHEIAHIVCNHKVS